MWSFFLRSGDNLSKVPSPPYCNRNPLIAIVGPTGAGKSELALRIAEQLDGEIVNCDSMQIYKNFDIGTAKVPVGERRGIPHHLLDFLEPTQTFSAGDYARAARVAIADITRRSRTPIIAGGTGFYLRALLEGLPDLPSQNRALRERLARWSEVRLHKVLKRLDPRAASRHLPQDRMRATRALEVRLLLGRPAPPLEVRSAMPEYSVRKLALIPPRNELYRKLDFRTEQMFRDGLVEEVQGLLAGGLSAAAKPFEAVGYRQALAVVEGRTSVDEAIRDTQQATRNYAKRQITWFRNDTGVEIFPSFGSDCDPIPNLISQKKRNHPDPSSNTL